MSNGQIEPDPAQDDIAAFVAAYSRAFGGPPQIEGEDVNRHALMAWWGWTNRPAQTEQQPELVMPVALGSVSADYDKGWADHAAEVRRLNAELLPSTPC